MNDAAISAETKPPSPYDLWQRAEGVPIIEGHIVPDMSGDLPMRFWPRKGVNGAFIQLRGGEGSMDAHVIELAPTKHTEA